METLATFPTEHGLGSATGPVAVVGGSPATVFMPCLGSAPRLEGRWPRLPASLFPLAERLDCVPFIATLIASTCIRVASETFIHRFLRALRARTRSDLRSAICHLQSEIPLLPLRHKVSHCLSRSLNRSCTRAITRQLSRDCGPRQRDELLSICRLLEGVLRIDQRMAKRDPHLFGPHARRYYLDTVRLAQEQQEIDAALCKVYGPPAPGEISSASQVWGDRYVFRTPEEKRIHLRWFKDQYGK